MEGLVVAGRPRANPVDSGRKFLLLGRLLRRFPLRQVVFIAQQRNVVIEQRFAFLLLLRRVATDPENRGFRRVLLPAAGGAGVVQKLFEYRRF